MIRRTLQFMAKMLKLLADRSLTIFSMPKTTWTGGKNQRVQVAKWFNLSYRGYARDSPSGMICPTMFFQVCLSNVKRDWANSFQNQKNASYQVFINLDRMCFIMESFTGFSPQTEFLPSLFFKAFFVPTSIFRFGWHSKPVFFRDF